jgi:hypothetical protein
VSTDNGPIGDSNALVIPAFRGSPALTLELGRTREAERRIIEAKTVNPVSYADLEHCFNESYRELKKNLSNVGYQISLADKALEQAKAVVLLDKYPDFMKDKTKTQDNADLRKAFLMRDDDYLEALDRVNQLKAMESFLDGKIKVMERVSAYCKKQMDILIRSGMANANLYITSGRN